MICFKCGGSGKIQNALFRKRLHECKSCKGTGKVEEPVGPRSYEGRDYSGKSKPKLLEEEGD